MLKNFEYKKSLGQNFINDINVIQKIVDLSNIDKETLVIEIGPGSGMLSSKIIPQCKFSILYEIDLRLKEILNNNLGNFENYKIIFNDFLKEDIAKEIKIYDYKKLYVIANLPYYITSPIIDKLIKEISADKIIIMVQNEVADRLCSKPGTKDYGYITAYVNSLYDAKKLFKVSRNSFTPVPNVDSAVIMLTKKDKEIIINNKLYFEKLLKDSFKYKRKNLKNNLSNYNLSVVNDILNKYNLKLTDRAENVSVEVFIDLANTLYELEKKHS